RSRTPDRDRSLDLQRASAVRSGSGPGTNAGRNAHTHSNADRNAHTNANSDTHSDAHANTDGDLQTASSSDARGANSDAFTDAHPNSGPGHRINDGQSFCASGAADITDRKTRACRAGRNLWSIGPRV